MSGTTPRRSGPGGGALTPCHTTCLSYHVHFSQVIIWYLTPGASKDVKFRLSRNSTKFDVVARFREMIPTVKSVLSSEI